MCSKHFQFVIYLWCNPIGCAMAGAASVNSLSGTQGSIRSCSFCSEKHTVQQALAPTRPGDGAAVVPVEYTRYASISFTSTGVVCVD